ncbi:MAG: carbamoyl-phosphate synthase (glutamine-hydrolyzing) small subunit, partial [Spirochaetaceae bacterium]|nr:carbamoyl-phosphate synthase (glutamine-hydrolyzing) small subunit [Spirochaetaceae bacterium]
MGRRKRTEALLVLEDGSEFAGRAFGKARGASGEVVFTTGMTGYPQTLTDPSFRGQIIVSTYPLAGNYGVPLTAKKLAPYTDRYGIPVHFESERIQASGFVVSENCEEPSHFASGATLSEWLEAGGVPGVCGVDTRALTKRLREQGVMRGKIVVDGAEDAGFDSGVAGNVVAEVSCDSVKVYTPDGAPERQLRIALV